MAEPKVTALRSIDLGVPDVAANARFYSEVWALEPVTNAQDSVYLRGTGPDHHILALHPFPTGNLLCVSFTAPTKAAVDALHAKAKGYGITEIAAPAPIDEPGGGYGFAFKDGEGRLLRILCPGESHSDTEDVADRPRKLSHIVLNSADVATATAFFLDVLGFKLSDQTRMFDFIRCNADHHSVSFAHAGASTLNHIAYEMPDLESVMRGAGRLRDNDYPIEWGVGRHGPGSNVFAYFVGPDDLVIEYTGEVDQVDDSYKVGKPEDWTWPPGRIDRWGVSGPPSDRLHAAQQRVGFAEDFFHPGG